MDGTLFIARMVSRRGRYCDKSAFDDWNLDHNKAAVEKCALSKCMIRCTFHFSLWTVHCYILWYDALKSFSTTLWWRCEHSFKALLLSKVVKLALRCWNPFNSAIIWWQCKKANMLHFIAMKYKLQGSSAVHLGLRCSGAVESLISTMPPEDPFSRFSYSSTMWNWNHLWNHDEDCHWSSLPKKLFGLSNMIWGVSQLPF